MYLIISKFSLSASAIWELLNRIIPSEALPVGVFFFFEVMACERFETDVLKIPLCR